MAFPISIGQLSVHYCSDVDFFVHIECCILSHYFVHLAAVAWCQESSSLQHSSPQTTSDISFHTFISYLYIMTVVYCSIFFILLLQPDVRGLLHLSTPLLRLHQSLHFIPQVCCIWSPSSQLCCYILRSGVFTLVPLASGYSRYFISDCLYILIDMACINWIFLCVKIYHICLCLCN